MSSRNARSIDKKIKIADKIYSAEVLIERNTEILKLLLANYKFNSKDENNKQEIADNANSIGMLLEVINENMADATKKLEKAIKMI